VFFMGCTGSSWPVMSCGPGAYEKHRLGAM
jgi:hypothetical protein